MLLLQKSNSVKDLQTSKISFRNKMLKKSDKLKSYNLHFKKRNNER